MKGFTELSVFQYKRMIAHVHLITTCIVYMCVMSCMQGLHHQLLRVHVMCIPVKSSVSTVPMLLLTAFLSPLTLFFASLHS